MILPETAPWIAPLAAAAACALAAFRAGSLRADRAGPDPEELDRENTARGLELQEGILRRLRGQYGVVHPYVWSAMDSVAAFKARLGDVGGASETLSALASLAEDRIAREDYLGASIILLRLAPAREALLGPDSPYTLRSYSRLGHSMNWTEDDAEARDAYAKAAEGLRKVYGGEHEETLDAERGLGYVLFNLRDYEAARAVLERTARSHIAANGPNHFATLRTVYKLGATLNELGDHSAARSLLAASAKCCRESRGPTDDLTLDIENQLAIALECLGEGEAAARLLKDSAAETAKDPVASPSKVRRAAERLKNLMALPAHA
ncbi:MAG: tetratricopeptide repeat protein [Deltaproteobacteria bacterium]|jgi:tetratricopeptide (TPR) repeat protein|nr:tetratricopeptide repeat protein [Deltaproteobacteria bacterium]